MATVPRLVVHVVGAGLWLTGALWLLFHYLLKRQGWLGAVHPLESWWLRFHGAFALALAEDRDPIAALRFAAAAAAIKCTRFGGISGAPQRAEVEALLATA